MFDITVIVLIPKIGRLDNSEARMRVNGVWRLLVTAFCKVEYVCRIIALRRRTMNVQLDSKSLN